MATVAMQGHAKVSEIDLQCFQSFSFLRYFFPTVTDNVLNCFDHARRDEEIFVVSVFRAM